MAKVAEVVRSQRKILLHLGSVSFAVAVEVECPLELCRVVEEVEVSRLRCCFALEVAEGVCYLRKLVGRHV